MTTATIPLHDLAKHIQRQADELARLRKELESRQARLSQLARRKEKLQAELRNIDQEIESVDQAGIPGSTPSSAGKGSIPASSNKAGKHADQLSLPQLLLSLVKKANRPITVKALAEEIVRSKFPTTSKNLDAMIKTRVSDLVKKGLLCRAADSSGVIVAQVPASANPGDSKAPTEARKNVNKPVSAKSGSVKWGSLRELLTHLLAKSSRPLSAQELADQVTKSGYESKSKDLKNVIWVSIGKMSNVERVKGEGYRLKKGKASGSNK